VLFFIGIIGLFVGQLSDLSIPLFIGMVIDLLTKEKYNEIYTLCLYLLGLVVVSEIQTNSI
jgi:ABC-type multidrug transport system fused ATPase/permease subunit